MKTSTEPRNEEKIKDTLEKYPTIKNTVLKGECLKRERKTLESHRAFSKAMENIFRMIENRKFRDGMSWKGLNRNTKDYEEKLEIIQEYIDEKTRSLYDEKLIPIEKE